MSGAHTISARIVDHNGWFEVPRNPLSKTGVFNYRGKSISKDLPPDAIFRVYRSAEELGRPETVNSFRLVPWIDDHVMLGDPELRGLQYMPPERKGIHGVIGQNLEFDANDGTLYGNIKLFSKSLAEAIEAGKKQLSLGYHCQYIYAPGTAPDGTPYDYKQVNILGNHNASVMAGKCGEEAAVMDCADAWQITFDEKEIQMVKPLKERNPKAASGVAKLLAGTYLASMKKKFPNAKLPAIAAMDADEEEAVSSEPGLSDVAEMLSDVLPQIADINAAIADASGGGDPDGDEDDMEPVLDDDGQPVMDAATGKPKMKKKAMASGASAATAPGTGLDKAAIKEAMDAALAPVLTRIDGIEARTNPKTFMQELGKRNVLADKLAPFIGAFDHSEMTTLDVAKYGVQKLGIPCQSGNELTALEAYLHNRSPARMRVVPTMDNTEGGNSVDKYLKPRTA